LNEITCRNGDSDPEYGAVTAGRSEAFHRVGDFYRHHGTCSQAFRKYYNRYLRSGAEADLLPQRRGESSEDERKALLEYLKQL
jgi:hypothetical protein